jgi:diketogulonate reductase-like aldo/keto reductase
LAAGARRQHHFPPGTTSITHLEENAAADQLTLTPETLARLDKLVNQQTVVGRRYSAATQAEIDTEEFQIADTSPDGSG